MKSMEFDDKLAKSEHMVTVPVSGMILFYLNLIVTLHSIQWLFLYI